MPTITTSFDNSMESTLRRGELRELCNRQYIFGRESQFDFNWNPLIAQFANSIDHLTFLSLF